MTFLFLTGWDMYTVKTGPSVEAKGPFVGFPTLANGAIAMEPGAAGFSNSTASSFSAP